MIGQRIIEFMKKAVAGQSAAREVRSKPPATGKAKPGITFFWREIQESIRVHQLEARNCKGLRASDPIPRDAVHDPSAANWRRTRGG